MILLLCLFLTLTPLVSAQTVVPRKFQIWDTDGQSSGAAHSADLVEVEAAKGGSLVRYVWAGKGSTGCTDIVVMAWEKRLALSPAALARPVNVCGLRGRLKQIASRHPHRLPLDYERDTTELVAFCDGSVQSADIPQGLNFEFKHDQDPDFVYLNHLWNLKDSIMSAAWGGNQPDPDSYEHSAQREGAKFAAQALRFRGSVEETLESPLWQFFRQHQGPASKPVYSWRLETPPGVRVVQFQEPRLFRSAYCAQFEAAKSTSSKLRLSVDPKTGKVTNSTIAEESPCWVLNQVLVAQTRSWSFDPSTLPAGGSLEVTVHLGVECGQQP